MRDKERAGEEEQALSLQCIPVWVSDFGKRGWIPFFRGLLLFPELSGFRTEVQKEQTKNNDTTKSLILAQDER